MSKSNLKNLKEEELKKDLTDKKEELRKARFNVAGTKGLKIQPAKTRKEIARILTELKSRMAK